MENIKILYPNKNESSLTLNANKYLKSNQLKKLNPNATEHAKYMATVIGQKRNR